MKCRIKKIISTAGAFALTFAAVPTARICAASIEEAPAVISVNDAVAAAGEEASSDVTTWDKYQKLAEDTVIEGSLYISADVDLNGFNLTVKGDVYQKSGSVSCNKGTLTVNGSYTIENTSAGSEGETVYNICYASLKVADAAEKVTIAGSFTIRNPSANSGLLLTEGTVAIGGNIYADHGVRMNISYESVLVLNGASDQYVNFGNSAILNELQIEDPDKREIVWSGGMNVRKLRSDINVKADELNLKNINLDGHNMTVNGECSMTDSNATVDINGGSLTFNGDFTHAAGTIACDNGTLTANGSYHIENQTVSAAGDVVSNICYASVKIANVNDKAVFNGNLVIRNIGSQNGLLITEGTASVKGNIYAENGIRMNISYESVLVLNGESDQYVNFGNSPILNKLQIADPGNRQIVWSGDMNVRKLLSDINVKADELTLNYIDLVEHNMTVNGECGMTASNATVDINSGSLTLNGDFTHAAGTIACDKGTLTANGNYHIENQSKDAAGNIIYKDCYAVVKLSSVGDKAIFNGNLVIHHAGSQNGLVITEGTASVKGNIYAENGIKMNISYESLLVLNGESDQHVNFGSSPILNELKIIKPGKRKIVWSGNMNVRKLLSDINVKADELTLNYIDINGHNMTVSGECGMTASNAAVDINGGSLTFNSDFTQSAGTIVCNKGTLTANGNYHIENPLKKDSGEVAYSSCYAVIKLSDVSDKANFNGNLVIRNIGSQNGLLLTEGTAAVKGNINAENGIRMNISCKSVLVLNGESDQYVNFGNSPILNDLQIADPDKRQIVWSGDMNVRKLRSDINVKADELTLKNIDLTGFNMTVNGECGMTASNASVDINGGSLTFNNDFTQSAGTIICNNGTMNVNGSYHIEIAKKTAAGDVSYSSCYANFKLNDEADKLNITGNLVLNKIGNLNGILLTRGTLTVGGNILAESGFNANNNYRNVTVLNGKDNQKVTLPKGEKFSVLTINKPLSCYEFEPEECWNELVTDYPAVVIKSWEKSDSAVKLNWDAVAGAEKYGIAQYINGKWQIIAYGTDTSYVLRELKAGVNYRVAVVAKLGGEWNLDVSQAVTVTPKSVNKYPAVKAEVSGRQFRLKWTAADGAEKYGIAVYQSGKWSVKVQLNGDITTYTSPKINRGTYKMVVCAKVNGKWDITGINSRAFTVTIK